MSNLVVDAKIYKIGETNSLKLVVTLEFDVDPFGRKMMIEHYGKSIGDGQGIGGPVESLPHKDRFNWFDSYEKIYLTTYPEKFIQGASLQGRVLFSETDYKEFNITIEKEVVVSKMY